MRGPGYGMVFMRRGWAGVAVFATIGSSLDGRLPAVKKVLAAKPEADRGGR